MPGPTGAAHRARSLTWLLTAALVVAACSGDTESFDLVSESDPSTTAPTTTEVSEPAPPAGDDAAETTLPSADGPDAPADGVPDDPTDGATTTTAATDTTAAPPDDEDQRVAALCDDLRTASFDERRELVSEADAAGATERCPDDVARTTAAVALRDRVDAVAASTDTPIRLGDVACNVTTNRLTFSARNDTSEPIGANIGVTLFDADGQPSGSASEPIVVWRLGPGESFDVDAGLTPVAVTDGVRCELTGAWFLADTGDVDAGLPGVQDAELASDDPAVWLGRLGETVSMASASGDATAVDVVEDLRSTGYDAVAELIESGQPVALAEFSICSSSSEGSPSPAWQWVVYEVTPAEGESFAEVGVFRRGSDGQWRWLSRAIPVDGAGFTGC